ncbi:hypothetical protein K7X08_030388 [Anisodus acutangulus]|uniref:Sugar phosphate transporter domain-containing protein n=1 Tax=Anisodus acutangulus TaxID=402998 RepID=A0A9Q1LR90_9SOLA|nr:hypothetical protein K7X08_030388 [Anisodus acutangulus]
MVKGRQGERVRLYTRGTVLGYKRSKSNQYPNTSLVQIEGVNTKEEVDWYLGKRHMETVVLLEPNSSPICHQSPWELRLEFSCTQATYRKCLVDACLEVLHLSIKRSISRVIVQCFTGVLQQVVKFILDTSLEVCLAFSICGALDGGTKNSSQFFTIGGNISLRYLPVSFNQAIGATTPFFTAVFAYLMTLKREAWLTYVTLLPVVTGVVIASGGEPSFHLFGFIMCVGATAARALKSVLQGILLSSEGEKLNSMNLLLYMAPIAVVFLLPATLLMEENVVGITLALARDDSRIIWLLLFNSALAYFVNLTNFLVTKHTSALTLQVLGNAKGAVAVVISILIFRNPVSVTGMLGYALTVFGVILYSEAKKRSK